MLLLLLLDLSITAQVRRRRRRRCWCHRCRRRRRNCPRRHRFAAILLAIFQLRLLPGRRNPVLRGSFFTVGQLVLEMIVFDRGAAVAAAHRAWNFAAAATIVSKVKITVDDGCDGGRNTVAASTVTITTTTAATATIALRNKDAVGVAVAGAGRS